MTALRAGRSESAWFTLAWFAVLLVVVFTTAFWLGRAAGPDGVAPEPAQHAGESG
ncbi:MAG TPA: hypothetical protein VFG72_15185 [Marmoricola sp.]|nr:hypothetical protein [Marmoricola sp.]